MNTPAYDAKSIRAVLEDFGFEIYSVHKKKRSVGETRYWYYQVELLSVPSLTTDDYVLAAIVLKEAGYSQAYYAPFSGLQFDLPRDLQAEHRARLESA